MSEVCLIVLLILYKGSPEFEFIVLSVIILPDLVLTFVVLFFIDPPIQTFHFLIRYLVIFPCVIFFMYNFFGDLLISSLYYFFHKPHSNCVSAYPRF